MSHYIPVFFCPIEVSELPTEMRGLDWALPLIEMRLSRKAEPGLYECISRNWWHQYALDLICTGLAITGVNFILAEVACLEGEALQSAVHGLGSVLDHIQGGIPDLGPTLEANGLIQGLRQYREGNDTHPLSADMYRQAFNEAQPRAEINELDINTVDKDLVYFLAFIKTLHRAANECVGQNKCLLYVRLRP